MSYSKEKIEEILRKESFRYHRVNLPYGLRTPGQDRSPTSKIIFPESLAGKTLLDVGCAIGYFCFEAEARGAARVVGLELKDDRFRQALILKDILDSKVEFWHHDVVNELPQEQFDYVCLLNVIHHLDEPMRALHQIAQLAREVLILEFPTLADVKFRQTTRLRFPWLYNRLPLIGVSSVQPPIEQTFVFAPSAIKRILQDHRRLFSKVKFLNSPMKGRKIAICKK